MAARKFQTTKWSLLQRIRSDDAVDSALAMETLCRDYWPPLYAWLRGSGRSSAEAEDLTQGFFAHAIAKNIFQKADQDRGRLRSFLLTSLRNYVNDVRYRDEAEKRGGGEIPVSLNHIGAHSFDVLVSDSSEKTEANPDFQYDYRWARMVMQHSVARLRQEHENSGKSELFHQLVPLLAPGKGDIKKSMSEIAFSLGSSEGAVRVALHRFKARFREIVREEVARTILPSDDIEEEIRYLVRVLLSAQ